MYYLQHFHQKLGKTDTLNAMGNGKKKSIDQEFFNPVKQFLTNKDKMKMLSGKSIDNLLLANMQYESTSG